MMLLKRIRHLVEDFDNTKNKIIKLQKEIDDLKIEKEKIKKLSITLAEDLSTVSYALSFLFDEMYPNTKIEDCNLEDLEENINKSKKKKIVIH